MNETQRGPQPARVPERAPLEGRSVRLEPLDAAVHAASLFAAAHAPELPRLWEWMGYGPFPDRASFDAWLRAQQTARDPSFFAVVPKARGAAAGMASYLRITPAMATIEIGHLWFGEGLQRTTAASEAIFLLLDHAFSDLGYRRVEWKCDARNEASLRAALRFGFRFDGVFRQHMIVKGRNRDTAWYAMLDAEWPALREGYRRWLAPDNFDATGCQRTPLSAFLHEARAAAETAANVAAAPRPTLVTPRLRLRPFNLGDAPAVQRIANDQRIAATTRLPYPYPEGLAARWIASHQGAFQAGVDVTFAIEHDGRLAGALALSHIDRHNANAELGFWLDPDLWGRGFVTEAAHAVVDWGFRERGLQRIYAFVMPHNAASARVLAKLSMRSEGLLRGHMRRGERYEDLEVMAVLRTEWEVLRAGERVSASPPAPRSVPVPAPGRPADPRKPRSLRPRGSGRR